MMTVFVFVFDQRHKFPAELGLSLGS